MPLNIDYYGGGQTQIPKPTPSPTTSQQYARKLGQKKFFGGGFGGGGGGGLGGGGTPRGGGGGLSRGAESAPSYMLNRGL